MQWNVVIPCYQQAPWLEACVRSVARATLTLSPAQFVATIVDDASPDGTPELARYLQAVYPWLRYIRHPVNRGVSAARNTGIRSVQSQYVLVLDADDRLSRKFLTVCTDVLATADIAFTDRRRFGDAWQYHPASQVTIERLQQGPFIHCSCPYRRA
ncbi:glycosyltransferase family 2 protein, partial [Candidatus Dojkabacteria bacterium]